MRKVVITAAFMALAGTATLPVLADEDHLAPEGSILGGTEYSASYGQKVRDALKDAYAPNVILRMVGIPSFVPEYAIGLASKAKVGRGAPYEIFTLTPSSQIWTYQSIEMLKAGQTIAITSGQKNNNEAEIARLQSTVPPNLKDVAVTRCDADISQPLGDRIIAVWEKMLLQTRYPERLGLDGATYHFFSGHRVAMVGQVWSPDKSSATGNLLALAEAMGDFCDKRDGVDEAALLKIATQLESRLN